MRRAQLLLGGSGTGALHGHCSAARKQRSGARTVFAAERAPMAQAPHRGSFTVRGAAHVKDQEPSHALC